MNSQSFAVPIPRRTALFVAGSALAAGLTGLPAQEKRGLENAELARADEGFYKRVRGLAIGINQYKFGAGIPKLSWAESDAEGFSAIMQDKYDYTLKLLLGSDATKAAITSELARLMDEADPDDALLVLFAGHGATVELDSFGRAGFLIPYDAELDLNNRKIVEDWRQSAIEMHALGDQLKETRARHVLLLADACYSGFLGKRGLFDERPDLKALARRKSRMVITAGTEEQQAIEKPELRHGIFTHAVLEGLSPADAPLSASELFVNVRSLVARKSNNAMLPQLRELVVDNGEFVFVPKSLAADKLEAAIVVANQRIAARNAKSTTAKDLVAAMEARDFRFTAQALEAGRSWPAKFERFQANADLGDPLAMAALYYCFRKGLGAEPSDVKAIQSARRAYDSNHPSGKHVLAECYSEGVGVVANQGVARELLEAAVEEKFAPSQLQLARTILTNDPSPNAAKKALAWLESAASEELPSAWALLGRLLVGLQQTAGIEIDEPRGTASLKKAAEAGDAEAAFDLYRLAVRNMLVAARSEAEKWLTAAARQGHPQAQAALAHEYYQRDGVFAAFTNYFGRAVLGLDRDWSEAYRWAELSAAQSDARGLVLLAHMRLDGHGCAPNPRMAREHLEAAVAMVYPMAIWQQGVWTLRGLAGYDPVIDVGIKKFEQAAGLDLQCRFQLARFRWRMFKAFKDGSMGEFGFDLATDPAQERLCGEAWQMLFDVAAQEHEDAKDCIILEREFGSHLRWAEPGAESIIPGIALFQVGAQQLNFRERLSNDANRLFERAERWRMGFLARGQAALRDDTHWTGFYKHVAEEQISLDEPGFAAFSLWFLERAAQLGHPGAKQALAGDRGDWWLKRGNDYAAANMAVEAYWSFERAATYGKAEARQNLKQFKIDYPQAVAQYEETDLRLRWNLRNGTIATGWILEAEKEQANKLRRDEYLAWATSRLNWKPLGHPEESGAFVLMARIHRLAGDEQKAQTAVQEALRLDPSLEVDPSNLEPKPKRKPD